ncbi:MAG: hypothetical protein WCS70_09135 [Verrucomicrobiota bacterium]
MDVGLVIGILGIAVVVGIVAFLVIGIPAMRKLGGGAGGLFYPAGDGRPVRPEYSVAEARAKDSQFAAAVAEYRKISAQYPDDVYVHIQIAQLAAEHLDDIATAEVELLTACAKAKSPDTLVLAHNRFADLYQFKLQNPARAIEIMEELRTKLPGTPAAQRAEERVAALKVILGGTAPAKLPAKIAFRKMDDKTRQERRGY